MNTARNLRSNSIIQITPQPSGEKLFTSISMDELFDNEAKCQLEMSRFLNDYSLDLLFGLDEITMTVEVAENLCDSFERVHVGLRRGLSEDEYKKKYAHFDERQRERRK